MVPPHFTLLLFVSFIRLFSTRVLPLLKPSSGVVDSPSGRSKVKYIFLFIVNTYYVYLLSYAFNKKTLMFWHYRQDFPFYLLVYHMFIRYSRYLLWICVLRHKVNEKIMHVAEMLMFFFPSSFTYSPDIVWDLLKIKIITFLFDAETNKSS